MRVTLAYSDLFRVSGTSPYPYVFRGNSLFDPDFTSTGHQPRYFDTYMQLYSKYKVLGSRIRISIINSHPSSIEALVLVPLTDVISALTYQDWVELSYSTRTPLNAVGGRNGHTIVNRMSTAKILGLRPSQVNDEDYSGTTGTNPVSIWYWNIGIFSTTPGAPISADLQIDIEYDTVLYDRINIGQSFSNPELNHVKQPREKALNVPIIPPTMVMLDCRAPFTRETHESVSTLKQVYK